MVERSVIEVCVVSEHAVPLECAEIETGANVAAILVFAVLVLLYFAVVLYYKRTAQHDAPAGEMYAHLINVMWAAYTLGGTGLFAVPSSGYNCTACIEWNLPYIYPGCTAELNQVNCCPEQAALDLIGSELDVENSGARPDWAKQIIGNVLGLFLCVRLLPPSTRMCAG